MRDVLFNPIKLKGPQERADYCERIAYEYDRLPAMDRSEVWRWRKLMSHVVTMYKRMSKQVQVLFVDGQPYKTAQHMRDSVKKTGVLKISRDFNTHPVFTPEENLKFRAVHDYVVHILPGKGGPDFTRKGELRAYNLHRRLAPKDAWPALFTEVAAQACYATVRGDFPAQKVAVFSDVDFYNVGLDKSGARLRPAAQAASARVANPEGTYFDAGKGQLVHFEYVDHRYGPDGREAYLLKDGRWMLGVRKTPHGNLLNRRFTKRPPKWGSTPNPTRALKNRLLSS